MYIYNHKWLNMGAAENTPRLNSTKKNLIQKYQKIQCFRKNLVLIFLLQKIAWTIYEKYSQAFLIEAQLEKSVELIKKWNFGFKKNYKKM